MGLFVKLDVEYASDEEFIEAGPLAELLYIRAVCFATTNDDNLIHRNNLTTVAARLPRPLVAAVRLVDVGLWTVDPEGWRIAGWEDMPRYSRRGDVFSRDDHQCFVCGAVDRLEVEHIIPIARNGTDDLSNLRTLCKQCNSSKKDR